jgi:hypothetical protein
LADMGLAYTGATATAPEFTRGRNCLRYRAREVLYRTSHDLLANI